MPLIEAGYDVVLVDAIPLHVDQARQSGDIVVAVISGFASTFDGLWAGFLLDERFERIVETDVATGHHDNVEATHR